MMHKIIVVLFGQHRFHSSHRSAVGRRALTLLRQEWAAERPKGRCTAERMQRGKNRTLTRPAATLSQKERVKHRS